MVRLLIALSDTDCDATEVAGPWEFFRNAGHEVAFATTTGARPRCDPTTFDGVLGGLFGATHANRTRYAALEQAPEDKSVERFSDIVPSEFDALHLPGGHAPGMRP